MYAKGVCRLTSVTKPSRPLRTYGPEEIVEFFSSTGWTYDWREGIGLGGYWIERVLDWEGSGLGGYWIGRVLDWEGIGLGGVTQ